MAVKKQGDEEYIVFFAQLKLNALLKLLKIISLRKKSPRTAEQIEKLKEEQANQNKSAEDIAKDQLSVLKDKQKDLVLKNLSTAVFPLLRPK